MSRVSTIVAQPEADIVQPPAVPHAWLTKLMDREGAGVLRMLWRLLRVEADVMDAYQDCFCKLAVAGKPRRSGSAKAYLYRTAANIAIELLRTRKRHRDHWPAVARARTARATPEPSKPEADSSYEAATLRDAVEKLPAHLRNVVLLRDFGGMCYKEVGKTLGIDPATARVYRRHAVVKLAGMLRGGLSDE